MSHDIDLARQICDGLQPKIPIYTSKLITRTIMRYWDTQNDFKNHNEITIQIENAAILLSCNSLIPDLHYEPFSRDWWYSTTIENKILLVPIHLGMTIATTLNEQKFILRVIQGHSKNLQQPGYYYQAGALSSSIEESCSTALTSLYQNIFQTKTKFSGPQELGFDDDNIKSICKIKIYHETILVTIFERNTPTEVWKKTGILQKFDSFVLFDLNDNYVKKRLELRESPTCRPTNWQNIFLKWTKKACGIMEIRLALQEIYPENHVFNKREIRAWHTFLKTIGCTNITSFGIDESKYKFWTKEVNPLHDQETLHTLFNNGFLRITLFVDLSKSCNNFTKRLSNCIVESYETNKKGVKGKRRILFIVADKFTLKELNLMKFRMSSRTIQEARIFARINGPDCPIIEKPIIYRTRFSEEAKNQFEKFFSDKSIVNMSSYKVDPQTKLPVLYLKDNKTALWKKFSKTYPDGFKRTTFMTELAQGHLVELILAQIKDLKYQSILIDKVKKVRRYMKRDYENEILIDANGQVNHDSCISHCLAYAFEICENSHTSNCEKCNKLWILFEQLQSNLDKFHSEMLDEACNKLYYYLSHQTRKVYLNSQFSASLRELDEDRALIVVDYKMRVLPKSAREIKDDQTIHAKMRSLLLHHFIQQLLPLKKSPNGFQLFRIMEVTTITQMKKWIFLEPGEAKTTIDSHHAQIAHAIRHFIQLRNDPTSGEKIETAIKYFRGTSVVHLEPNRNTGNQVKTLTGISKWYSWQWPCEGTYSEYIQARPLPNVGEWISFSLAQINYLVKQKIDKPESACTSHSIPKASWNIPVPDPSNII
ncbi:hypothetical protein Glove_283g56 [Diversispora epigaea]|uniref:Uncharacterized protein n=1 Tax=Diversispora epigaea TaxID=1348612 RepID=A0A397I2P8_9GLOM|nr:hypothetical protein Glove_283g56 [Diversispora epigaea]